LLDTTFKGKPLSSSNSINKVQVERNLGIVISWAEYYRMRTELTNVVARYPRKTFGLCTEQSMDEFTSGRKRGCKRYRRIMEGRNSKKYSMRITRRQELQQG
jgi:hypothetical protein